MRERHIINPRKGARGERNHRAKLTASQVREIRRAYRDGATQVAIAAICGVRPETIGKIISGENWGWLK